MSNIESPSIAGVWKLKSYSRRYLDSGEIRNDMLPHAYIMYTPGGYMMSITVEENRSRPAGAVLSDEERLHLFKTIVSAYSGTYKLEAGRIVHHVELSWNEAWTGTDQVREYMVEGETLILKTTPRTTGTDSRQVINTLTWERVEAFPLAMPKKP